MNSSRECARVLISRYSILFIQSIVFVFFSLVTRQKLSPWTQKVIILWHCCSRSVSLFSEELSPVGCVINTRRRQRSFLVHFYVFSLRANSATHTHTKKQKKKKWKKSRGCLDCSIKCENRHTVDMDRCSFCSLLHRYLLVSDDVRELKSRVKNVYALRMWNKYIHFRYFSPSPPSQNLKNF